MIPEEILQDRNHDGIVDFLNARIYVDDRAALPEIVAAANVAARLAFEAQSIDLPIGFPISKYNRSDRTIAVVIGTAAKRFSCDVNAPWTVIVDGTRKVVAIPNAADAERFARTLGMDSGPVVEIRDPSPAPAPYFSLSSLYSSDGLLRGTNGSLFPEAVNTEVRMRTGTRSFEVINLAARIALESAAVRLPLVCPESAPARTEPVNAIAVGNVIDFPGIPSLPGIGRIQIVDLLDGSSSVCISGTDSEGEAEALKHTAMRLPYVWEYGKEHLHLSRIEDDLHAFFQFRSAAGQTAAVMNAARDMIRSLSGEERASASLTLCADTGNANFESLSAQWAPGLLNKTDFLNNSKTFTVFDDSFDIPWEVDDARSLIDEFVLPRIRKDSEVQIELRISESSEIRDTIAKEIQEQVLMRGANPGRTTIHVLSAHKQAYCWIDEILKPRLRNAHRVRICFQKLNPGKDSPVESPERWLHELYPIDEVLAKDLGIPLDHISFHESDSFSATYEVSAEDTNGRSTLREKFSPVFAMRPMFDEFPEYAQIRVSTGWLRATVDGVMVADARIATDVEKFWNRFQSETLPKVRNYISNLHGGLPAMSSGPHFAALEVELWLSEPDRRISIDQERISTLEPLHEDIYFETLLFLDLLGIKNPGRIVPRIHPARNGRGGSAHIRLTGRRAPNPRIELSWTDLQGQLRHRIAEIEPRQTPKPRIEAITVQAGHDSVVVIDVSGVDATKENLALFEMLRQLRSLDDGLDWISYEGIDSIRFGGVAIGRTTQCFRQPKIKSLPRIEEKAEKAKKENPVVQSRTPIGPVECERIIQHLAAFPEVRPFHAGSSLLGNSIWAMDVTSPLPGKYVSQARVSLSKPVLFVTGRQHANEVSSTTHILKLAEMLATDRKAQQLLNRVSFILQPITNPDGAALVEELHGDTSEFMLHAGYMGSLGTDVTLEQWSPDPVYPEARVRPRLWRMWLPDIVLNPHGYPSHEWVQLFAGYTAWVKSRDVTARDWWIPRGWFIPRFEYGPESQPAAMDLHDKAMTHMKTVLESNDAWHKRMKGRYAKYGLGDLQPEHRASEEDPDGFTFAKRYPRITWLETVSEAPDEVASGDWLETLTDTGLQFSLFLAHYLAENSTRSERFTCHSADSTVLRIVRRRP